MTEQRRESLLQNLRDAGCAGSAARQIVTEPEMISGPIAEESPAPPAEEPPSAAPENERTLWCKREEQTMGKHVLIVSSSLRGKSNSELLAKEAERGAKDAGHEVELVSLKDKDIRFCKGCLACQRTGKCVIQDDVQDIMEKIQNAEVVVFVTPIYYYELSGQLKTLLDRCNPLFPQEYRFREIYLITTSAEDGDEVSQRAVNGLKGWIECFPKCRFAGAYSGGGVNEPAEVSGRTDLLDGAYHLGHSL